MLIICHLGKLCSECSSAYEAKKAVSISDPSRSSILLNLPMVCKRKCTSDAMVSSRALGNGGIASWTSGAVDLSQWEDGKRFLLVRSHVNRLASDFDCSLLDQRRAQAIQCHVPRARANLGFGRTIATILL